MDFVSDFVVGILRVAIYRWIRGEIGWVDVVHLHQRISDDSYRQRQRLWSLYRMHP